MAKQTIIFSPAESMQSALTKVNENFTELYENPSDDALTKTESFNVNPAIRTYKIDRTLANIVATFDFTTCNGKTFDFIIDDDSAHTFSVNDVSGTAENGVYFGYGDTGNADHHFSNGEYNADELTLQPGEYITLAAKAATGTPSYVTGSLNTREDI